MCVKLLLPLRRHELVLELLLHHQRLVRLWHQVVAQVISQGAEPDVSSITGESFVIQADSGKPDALSGGHWLDINEWDRRLHCLSNQNQESKCNITKVINEFGGLVVRIRNMQVVNKYDQIWHIFYTLVNF